MISKTLVNQFFAFLGVGAIATFSHYFLLVVLVEIFSIGVVLASAAGAVLGAVVSYFLNRSLTFQSDLEHRVVMPKFMTVAILAVVVNTILMQIFTQYLGIAYLLAQALVTVILITVTFGLNKVWSFKEN